MGFLAKYLRENTQVNAVNLDVGKVSSKEFKKVADVLKTKTNVSRFTINNSKLNRALQDELKKEIAKNKSVYQMVHPNLCDEKVSLNLKNQSLSNIAFVTKYVNEHQKILRLNLSHNNLGNKSMEDLSHLLSNKNCPVQVLDLSHNKISTKGLQTLCSALTHNKSIHKLNIEKNQIPLSSMKTLLIMLYHNENIYEIKYDGGDHPSLQEFKAQLDAGNFKDLAKLQRSSTSILKELSKKDRESKKKKDTAAKKVCKVAFWPVLTFYHSKHDAFKFKYDTEALNMLE